MVIRFVRPGSSPYQAMGIILGADIGTTFTVQLLAFHIYDYALLLSGSGCHDVLGSGGCSGIQARRVGFGDLSRAKLMIEVGAA